MECRGRIEKGEREFFCPFVNESRAPLLPKNSSQEKKIFDSQRTQRRLLPQSAGAVQSSLFTPSRAMNHTTVSDFLIIFFYCKTIDLRKKMSNLS